MTMEAREKQAVLRVISAAEQGSGAFDGGKITEIKPVPFPHEGGGVDAMGPLFYWAWASARGDGLIGMHPHKGFEIVSYALDGEIGHSDTLGTKSRVGKGGAQVMQTGSGVSHEEEMYGEQTEFFQIWFEPDLKEALKRAPTYAEFWDEDFPREKSEGAVVKRVLGAGSPMELVAEVSMVDVTVEAGASYAFEPARGKFLAMMTVEGSGELSERGGRHAVKATDFVLAEGVEHLEVSAGDGGVRLVAIEAPREVGYPFYAR
jgi:redox-sensitive bicupin YhaK (pirin superfamily)